MPGLTVNRIVTLTRPAVGDEQLDVAGRTAHARSNRVAFCDRSGDTITSELRPRSHHPFGVYPCTIGDSCRTAIRSGSARGWLWWSCFRWSPATWPPHRMSVVAVWALRNRRGKRKHRPIVSLPIERRVATRVVATTTRLAGRERPCHVVLTNPSRKRLRDRADRLTTATRVRFAVGSRPHRRAFGLCRHSCRRSAFLRRDRFGPPRAKRWSRCFYPPCRDAARHRSFESSGVRLVIDGDTRLATSQ